MSALDEVDDQIRSAGIAALRSWHITQSGEIPGDGAKAMSAGAEGRIGTRADAVGFLGRTLVVLGQRAGASEYEKASAMHLMRALEHIKRGRYETAIADT